MGTDNTMEGSMTINNDVIDRLARIETKLDQFADDREETKRVRTAYDARLSRLERFMWVAMTLATTGNLADLAAVFPKTS